MAAVGGLLVEGNLGEICWFKAIWGNFAGLRQSGGTLLVQGNLREICGFRATRGEICWFRVWGGDFQSLFLAISDLSRQDAHLVYEEHPAPVDATVLYKIS